MPALCIVATPLSAARAARRLCDAQGGLLFGPRVATLAGLVPGLLAASGDRRAVLPRLAERLVATEAARAAGPLLATCPPEGGLAAALAAAIAELRRAEVSAADARAAAALLEDGAAARLRALAEALEAYDASLERAGVLDAAGAARAAAGAARRGASSAETDALELLVVDGVTAVSAAEWDLLATLAARARRTRFHVPYLPERPDLCTPAEPLLRRVEALHEVATRREVDVVLPHLHGEGRAALPASLLEALAGGRASAAAAEGVVLAAPGAGEAGEIEAVASALLRLVDAGLAPGDLAVIAPAPRRAAPALARACAAAGLPFSAGRGAPLAETGPARLALDALAAARGLDRSAAERLAASSYLGSGLPGALGPLLDRAGALDGRGAPGEVLRARAARLAGPASAVERDALSRAALAVEALEASLRPLAAPGTGREHAARLGAFLDAAGVRRRAARAPADVAARDLAALSALADAADGVARALALAGRGAERLPADAYRALLALAVDEIALPAPAEPAAGAIELWGLDEAAGVTARGAVLMGCAHGAWPVPPRPEPLLREPERQALNRHLRRAAVGTAAARRAEARHRALCAVAAGREAVVFAWGAPGPAGDGAGLAPFAADALAALGIAVPSAPPADPDLSGARTARAALRAAARAGPPALRALRGHPLAARAAAAVARGGIEARRREAVRGRRPARYAGAVDGAAGAALRAMLPDQWSASQLEEYARCPFRLFLQLAARLEEPGGEGLDIDARDEGSLLHAVLERFVRARVARRAWPVAASAEDLAEARAVAGEVFAAFERDGRTGDPAVWAARRVAVLGRIERVVRAEAHDHEGLVPALLEHAFGGRSGRPALTLTAGGEAVALRGRVDRVDAGPDRLLVLDYKNAKAGRSRHAALLDPEAFGRASFQIPIYLLAAARDLPGRPRTAATYALLRSAERLPPVELAADDPLLAGGGPFQTAVVEGVRRIRSGAFPIAASSCEHCAFGAVCRFEGVAAAGDGAEGGS